MAVDAESVWKDTLALLPKVGDSSWAFNFANWVAGRVLLIEPDPTKVLLAAPAPVGFLLTFNSAMFAAKLLNLAPSSDASSSMSSFADAWASTIQTAIYPATLNMLIGASGLPTTPATTFSTITTVIIDPASIEKGKAKILELASAPAVSDPKQSQFPVKFREAFLQLKINVTGVNSVTPTPAPYQLSNISLV